MGGQSKLRMGRLLKSDRLPNVGEESMPWRGEKGQLEEEVRIELGEMLPCPLSSGRDLSRCLLC